MIRRVRMLSETGAYRQSNQDAVLAAYTEYAGIFAVADGMGGHYKGEIASREAVARLYVWWEEIKDCILSIPFLDIVSELENRVREINESVYQIYQEMGQYGGTTLCILMVCKGAYAVLNIGDSRLYKRQGRECVQMTVDDVWENQRQVRLSMGEEDIRRNPAYGKLVQAVGTGRAVRITVRTGCMGKKTCFLLCSDGIYKYCDETWLFRNLKKISHARDADRFVEKVRETVYRNGAGDNFSLIIIMLDARDKSEKRNGNIH